jgi:hypothetical protein
MRILVLPHRVDQIRDIASVHKFLEHWLELLRLARGQAVSALLVYDHPDRK